MAARAGKSPLLTVAETADYLNLSVNQVWRLRFRRTIPCIKLGRSVRFHVDDLDSYIEGCREDPETLRSDISVLRRRSA